MRSWRILSGCFLCVCLLCSPFRYTKSPSGVSICPDSANTHRCAPPLQSFFNQLFFRDPSVICQRAGTVRVQRLHSGSRRQISMVRPTEVMKTCFAGQTGLATEHIIDRDRRAGLDFVTSSPAHKKHPDKILHDLIRALCFAGQHLTDVTKSSPALRSLSIICSVKFLMEFWIYMG